MKISKILNSLEKSWDRDDILFNLKKGLGTDEIVNEFLVKNESKIKELNSLLRPEDIDLLNQVEQLSTCESKLINKIKNRTIKYQVNVIATMLGRAKNHPHKTKDMNKAIKEFEKWMKNYKKTT